MEKKNEENAHGWRYRDPEDCDSFEPMRPVRDKAMPVSSRRQAKNASRKTEGSRKASKRIARKMGGMNRRRVRRTN
ncbi:MAG: hypothetical protein CMJ81_00770 [Planctomycetaceae bacterium]|nr:hypothetical protein [Planctomycetaceae bacterium]MBP60638.1 hypothetical protein [Planctomycetaceae bacterium]